MKTKRSFEKLPCLGHRAFLRCAALGAAAVMTAAPTQAAFHLWSPRELYTDASGNLQFIELFTTFSGQTVLGGMSLTVTPTVGTPHTVTVPGNLGVDSANKALLFGTAGLHAAGGPTPDYIIPNGFLFSAGGTLSFFSSFSGTYTALPTDGVLSRAWGGGNAPNSPVNFAGTSTSVVPEPATLSLLLAGGLGLGLLLRRRLS